MPLEHQPQPDRQPEARPAELEALAKRNLEAHESISPEQAAEHQEQRAEQARELLKQPEAPVEQPPAAEAAPKPSFMARLDHHLNYTQTLQSVQRQLAPASRRFSQVIYTPAVEKTSEVLETVMRPSVIAGATWTALIVGLVFYLTARTYGFNLAGSEMLLALLGGGLLGGAIEGLVRLLRARHH